MLAAVGMAAAPVAANAASALSLGRSMASMTAASALQAEDDDDDGGGSTAVILGVVLVVLIGIAAISGNSSEPSNSP
jgi:ABC-type phosphate transport system permease subunit